jgi:hypothetical protein
VLALTREGERSTPCHEVDYLLAVEIDDAEGGVGRQRKCEACGGRDDVRFQGGLGVVGEEGAPGVAGGMVAFVGVSGPRW